MKTALVTTTIHVPVALKVYRAIGPDVEFFIAGDYKTPHEQVRALRLANTHYYDLDQQRELDYACSNIIGQNTIGLRNIALLEALRWGAEIIVFWDDDNLAINGFYFENISELFLSLGFHGIEASSLTHWFDVGTLLDPPAKHRGFPYDIAQNHQQFNSVVDVRCGVAAGICLGDPDIDAITRIATHPTVHRVSELLRAGIVTDPRRTWTVFNSQNTAFIRALAPAFLMHDLGRYDDIFASLIAQRIMRDDALYVHFGQPFVWQQRNEHDLLKDLDKEIWGMNYIHRFVHFLEDIIFPADFDVVQRLEHLYDAMERQQPLGIIISTDMVKLGRAWLQDVAKVMG